MTESSRPEIANRTNPDRPLPGAMPDRLPETAPKPEFDAKSIAKNLLRTVRAGALATIDRNTGHPWLTVLGGFAKIARDAADEAHLRRRFLARHPKAELYAGFADFALWRMTVESAHLEHDPT